MIAVAGSSSPWVLIGVAVITAIGVTLSARSAAHSQKAAAQIAAAVEERKVDAKSGGNVFTGYDELTANYRATLKELTVEVEALRVEARTAREDLAKAQLTFRYVWGRLNFPEGYEPIADTEQLFARVLAAVAAYDL